MPWQQCEPVCDVKKYCLKTDTYEKPPEVLQIALESAGERVTDYWFHARAAGEVETALGPFAFKGRWLYWREDARGRVLRAASHAGATASLVKAQGAVAWMTEAHA